LQEERLRQDATQAYRVQTEQLQNEAQVEADRIAAARLQAERDEAAQLDAERIDRVDLSPSVRPGALTPP
jgi:hypothetical protein